MPAYDVNYKVKGVSRKRPDMTLEEAFDDVKSIVAAQPIYAARLFYRDNPPPNGKWMIQVQDWTNVDSRPILTFTKEEVENDR